MLELSMNEVTTFRWSFEEDVENYCRAGYRSIGVWRHKLADLDEEYAVDLLAGSGLSVSSLACAGGFTGVGGVSFQRRHRRCDRRAATGREDRGRLPGGPSWRSQQSHLAACLSAAATWRSKNWCRSRNTTKCRSRSSRCTWPAPAHWTFLTDFERVANLVAEYNSPYLKLACDTYHFPWSESDRDILGDIAQHIGVVYLADRREPPSIDHDRCPLGSGQLPLADIVATLFEAGYAGPFDIRLMGPDIQHSDYGQLLQQSRWAFADLVQGSTSRSLA